MSRSVTRLALGAALALALSALPACRPAPPDGDEVRVALAVEPPHLNPLLGDPAAIAIALGDVFEPLVRPAEAGGPLADELVLAARWDRTDGDRTWRFTLRRDARWHDGAPFTAADVAATFGLLARLPTPLAAEFDDLEALETPAPDVVVMKFKGYRFGRPGSLARVPILPAHLLVRVEPAKLALAAVSRQPVGTGPYRVARWDGGVAIELERAPGARVVPPVAKIRYLVLGDRAQALAQLRAGAIDLVPSVPLGELADAGPDARAIPWEAQSTSVVVWNQTRPALKDPRVRRALTMTLDRPGMVRELLGGHGHLLATPWPDGDPAHDPSIAPWPVDGKAAAALLKDAGAASLTVEILVPETSATFRRVATIWAADARAAGITIVPRPVPFATLLERAVAGDYDGVALGMPIEREQDLWHVLHSSQLQVGNLGRIVDAEIDRLTDAIRTTADPAARQALEHALGARLHELEPFTVVFGDVRVGVAGPRLAGLRIGPLGAPARAMRLVR